MKNRVLRHVGAIAMAGSLVAGLASVSAPALAMARAHRTAAKKFIPPNLKGQTLTFAFSGSAQVSDTVMFMTIRVLRSWGADVKYVNLTGNTSVGQVVLAGDAQIGDLSLPTLDNSGLVAIGVNQPHVDYFMMSSPSIKSVNQLKGRTFAVSNTGGIEAAMLRIVLSQHHIPQSAVHMILSGGASVRAEALLTGKIDAAWVLSEGYLTIKESGGKARVLVVAGKDIPFLADSYLGTSRAWATAHPKLATAVDEAWIEAARTFNTNESAWVAAARAYVGPALQGFAIKKEYQILKNANCWDYSPSVFSPKIVQENLTIEKQTKSITTNRSLNNVAIFAYWNQAQKAMQ